MNHDDSISFLKQINLFQGFTQDQLLELAKLATELSVPSGEIIIKEGEESDRFYIIKSGSVEVIKKDKNNIDYTVATLKEGDIIGEVGLIANKKRNASVRIQSTSVLLVFSIKDFQGDLHKHLYLTLSKNIAEVLINRLDYAYNNTIETMRISAQNAEKVVFIQKFALVVLVVLLLQLGGMFYYFFYSKSFCQTINAISNHLPASYSNMGL